MSGLAEARGGINHACLSLNDPGARNRDRTRLLMGATDGLLQG
jgi:hypothetical protein